MSTTLTPPPETEIKPPVKAEPATAADVEIALHKAAVEKIRSDRVCVIAEMFTLALFSLLIPALLDYRYFWSATDRFFVEGLWLVLLGFCIARVVIKWRRIPTSKTVALDLERFIPETHCEVSTASQYTAGNPSKPLEAELVAALQQRAATHLQRAGSPYRLPLIIAGCVLALGAALFAITLTASPISRIAVQRILVPAGTAHYTDVDVHPGDAEIAIGDNFDVTVQFHGRLPGQAFFEWKETGGSWQSAPLVQTAPDSFSYQLKNVQVDTLYRIRGNDALSPEYHLHAYTAANIASWQIEIVPPAYANLPTQHSETGNVTTLRGSELHWHLVPTLPLQKVGLEFKDSSLNVALKAESTTSWSGGITLKTDQTYHAALVDTVGHAPHNSDTFRLTAFPDAPPAVEITGVDENISAGAQDKIHFNIQADDDLGLANLQVIYQHPGSPDSVVTQFPDRFTGRHLTRHPTLDLAPFNLQPYDVLIFYAEATDTNTLDGPGVTRSHVFFVTIKPPPPPDNGGGDGGGGGGGGQQVNLTAMERDLISGTARLSDPINRPAMADLATTQRQVKDYATTFAEKLADAPDALAAMKTATDAMDQASAALDGGDRAKSLEEEEKALLALYQVARLIPPTDPEAPAPGQAELTIMLEDLAQKKGAQEAKTKSDLESALQKARDLEKGQQGLKGQNDPKAQGDLAGQAQSLAQDLKADAGSDPGLSHSLGETAGDASGQMQTAADALAKGDTPAASQAQDKSLDALGKLIAGLEKALGSANHKSDVSSEEAPPEFEDQLSHYYEKLSHEK